MLTGALPIITTFTLLHRISSNPTLEIPCGWTHGEGREKRGGERGKWCRKRGKRGRKMGKRRMRGKQAMSSETGNGNGVIL